MSFLLLAFLLAAPQDVSNRPAAPDEIGYRPADKEALRLTPPSFAWLPEPGAAGYVLEWARRGDFSDAIRAADLPWHVHTPAEPLPPGAYRWRYRYVDAAGRASGWSAVRSFSIPPDAVPFPMPSRAQRAERIPREHPRLFLRPEDLPRLREAARGRAAARFDAIRQEADRLLETPPTPEPEVRASAHDPATTHLWWPNRVRALQATDEACTLAFVYLVTGEPKYGQAARDRILRLAAWDPDGPTNFRLNCEAAKPLLYRLPRAYDWAYGALTPQDRERVRTVMLRRARDAWESREVGRGTGHLHRPYGSHANRTWHKLMECALAFYGELPEAETWLDFALNTFFAAYPVWSDDDGGWHEGATYWAAYLGKVVWALQVMRSALGIEGLRKPFFSQVGDFPLYVAPPGSPNMGFGDLASRTPAPAWGGFLEYFLRAQPDAQRAGLWRWWAERWGLEGETGILGFLYEATLGPLPPARPPAELPPSKVFRGVGVASLHVTLLDSAEDVHVLFKSSPFGTRSHGHNAQNSFQLNAYGEALLPACVFRDLHGSRFHFDWVHETVAQNAVLVNGRGQVKRSPAPTGRLTEARLGSDWDYVAGDATDAYGGRLLRARRHVLFAKPDVLVLYDDLAAPEPATFQFLLHAYGPFEVDAEAAGAGIDRPRAGADVRYLSPVPLAFRQWDGYDPPPTREFPNMWHLEAATRDQRAALEMLTVIVPYRSGAREAWTAERIDEPGAVGIRLTRGGRTTVLAFRRPGVEGPIGLGGRAFEGPAAVLR